MRKEYRSDHLLVKEINVEREVRELDCAGSELDVELIEVDVTQNNLPKLLL